jgi:hypothetical protein
VKTGKDIIKKCISLLVLVLYFFMVTTYILYLPSYTSYNNAGSSFATGSVHLHNSHRPNNSYIQLHGAFKSVPENKRKTINVLINTAALIFLLIFSVVTLLGLIKRSVTSLSTFFYRHPHYYLSLRTLRI